jgi:Carboxypeptidase regulatory-like domain
MKILKSFAIAFVFAVFLSAAPAWAQTASTALVLGTVTDPGGAVVPDAAAELVNTATNEVKSVTTNSAGQYVFPNVAPGTYTLKISKAGFATITFSNIKFDVSKSYTYDAKLEVSSGKEIVEVSTGAVAELQTADATIGNVIGGTEITRLPTLGRDASELLTLQPGSTPYDSNQVGFGNNGGTIAGARSDQNSIVMDGIDVTDNVISGGATEKPIIPIGVESIDEFRAEITNENVTFLRSSGGQVDVISKSGTNSFHGSTYWFHQNSALNANSWDNNRNKIKKPPTHDNRGGFFFGGPLRKDKTFFFANYELRRFPQSLQDTRIMPSDQLRNGVLQFQDCAQGFKADANGNQVCQGGSLTSYNLNPANTSIPFNPSVCGADATTGQPLNLPCDPRNIGISPTIAKLWGMMPHGTDTSIGDGNNTLGDRLNLAAPLKTDFISFRLDHKFTDKVQFFGRYMYSRNVQPNDFQVDLRGANPITPSNSNLRGDGEYGGLDWQIRPNLTNSFRAGWIRARQDFTVIRPSTSAAQLALPGTDTADGPIALAPGLAATGFIDTVVDVDTQRARHQAIYDSSKQYNDMITWTKGRHTLSSGADIRWLPTIHDRDDKVVGSLNSLVAAMDSDVNFLAVAASDRPPTCAPQNGANPAVTTNCLLPGDVQRWDRLYAASLGLIDNVGILTVRDGSLNPKPFGTTLIAKTTLRMYEFFVQDSWRMNSSLTLTYGLGYGWQTTPQELHQQQTLIANHDAGDQIIDTTAYFQARAAAAQAGQIYNPRLSYIPVKFSGRSNVFNVDYGNLAPRLSLAWNPGLTSGFAGRLFGNKKTVVRAGYGIGYDRVNTVQSVIIPMLGVGFAQTINVVTPLCNATSTAGGTNCTPGAPLDPGLSSFRVGVDGSIPLPATPQPVQSPIVPGVPFSETLSFQNDPDFKVGRSHMIDFTIQRELPGQNILEIGYVGRLGRDLAGSFNLNSAPYFFKDNASGQTFAQAFDAIATSLRNKTTVTTQAWFEDMLPNLVGNFPIVNNGATCGNTATQCMVNLNSAGFINGNVTNLFLLIDGLRGFSGPLDSKGNPTALPTFNNRQVFDLFMRSHKDYSNYHALVVTLRNRPWHGVLYDMNYTFSKSLDTVGAVQNSASYYATSFHPGYEYGPSLFDRTHVINGTFNYDLPLGNGHRLGSSHAAISKVIGGWYTAGVVRFSSGIPLLVTESNQVFGGGAIFAFATGEIPSVNPNSLGGGVNNGVCAGPGNPGSGSDGPNCASQYPTGTTLSGSGINYFKNPGAALKDFRPILLASDTTTGRSRPLRGFWFKNLDMRLGKVTKIRENLGLEYSFDFFNAFNHPTFLDPTLDTTNLANFGVVNTQLIPANRNTGSRWIQFGLRVEF